ncbi:hypothetical protein M0812_20034 [Anaeramoeba flamelloides]|uniref:BTB domain-containing protein n=1 Tax=Anaeramoeba flamelloides TaxID=1746091 RepID=A0AAV7YVU4_9EUKA|nr:hypothetical protein M0812_20034 [Anaeramoeba flamelloides]
MTNILGLGGKFGNWRQPKDNFSLKPESLTILPEEVTQIVDVISLFTNKIVFLSSEGKLYQTDPNQFQEKLKAIEDIPPIKSIVSGYYHILAISDEEQPKAYGWGDNESQQFSLLNKRIEKKKPTLIKGLEKITFHEIYCAGYGSFFLNTTTNVLYGCGENYNNELGVKGYQSKEQIIKLHENVVKVFTDHSDHVFIIKTDGNLYGFGTNENGQLGDNKATIQQTPIIRKFDFPVEKISKIVSGFEHTAILTTDGKLYVSGNKENTGFGSDLLKLTEYPQFKKNNTFIKDISSGYEYLTYLTKDNEIWMTGNSNQDYNNNDNSYLLKKITTINENFSFETLRCCDKPVVFLLNLERDYLSQDLGNLLEKGSLSDCKIQNIPVHKILIETRLGKDFAQVSNYLEENCTLKEIEHVLKWIYSDRIIKNSKRTKEILSYFGIENPSKTKLLKNDLKKLLFDEESSDFKLVIKNDEEEEEEEEEDDEKLPVHKFLLAARSGLFLDLFQNLDQNLNNVQDYSGKSLETLELLISFLYTDEIPITADTDQEFIKEEFEDIVDYYQLNPKIPLLDIFEKCSKK